ncbi:TetR/AcrR family transcriptional regulator [Brachybacterium sp. GCM10030267]|uniref:TetR/AcrR family transcriptional regulator n=1 Tax=unclassified Brachybacterium TaxID=2623841 RepID=UPI00361EAEFB
MAGVDSAAVVPPEGVALPADTAAAPTATVQAPAAPPTREKRSSRREKTLEGAAEMFAEYGYYGASLRDIAARVGISHPGMLHHFASKEALLDAVIDLLEAHAQEALDEIDELGADPDTLLRGLARFWHPGCTPIQLLATLDANVISSDHPGRFRVARLRRVHEHVLEQCLAALDERGFLQEGVEPAFAARTMVALVLSHAMRERTVRTMQSALRDDAPMSDLGKLVRLILQAG